MKLIHCADLHLDAGMHSFLTQENAALRREELLRTFLRMVEYAVQNGIQGILIAGDLFDRKFISTHAFLTVQEAIASHPSIIFFYVSGNHEGDEFIRRQSELPYNLKLFSRQGWTRYDMGNVSIYGTEKSDSSRSDYYDELRPESGRCNLVLMHGQISEYADSSKRDVISLQQLKNRNITYLALGHVHSYQEGVLQPAGVWCYPGCLEGRGFDECGVHGFVVLDIDPETGEIVRSFQPMAYRSFHEIRVDVSGCSHSFQIQERIRNEIDSLSKREMVTGRDAWKIILCGSVSVDCEKNLTFLRDSLAEHFWSVRIYDETRIEINYSEYLLDASLKGEFVRLIQSDPAISGNDKANIIRCGIQVLRGEEIEI